MIDIFGFTVLPAVAVAVSLLYCMSLTLGCCFVYSLSGVVNVQTEDVVGTEE